MIALRPPCTNPLHTKSKPAFAIMTPDHRNIMSWFIGLDAKQVEAEYAFRYFQTRQMEAEEDSDLTDVLPNLTLYIYEFSNETPGEVQKLFDNYSDSHLHEAQTAVEIRQISEAIECYARLASTCKYLDYCDMPETDW